MMKICNISLFTTSVILFTALTSASAAETKTNTEPRPYIEIEKYDANNSEKLKVANQDKIKLLAKFQFNNLEAKNLSTLSTFNLNTSSEIEMGVEYNKHISDYTNAFIRLSANQFIMTDVTTVTPNLDASQKSQAVATLGGQYLFTDDNYLDYYVSYRPHFYFISKSNGHLELDYAASPSIGLETENHFYNYKGLVVGANFGAEYISNIKASGNNFGFNAGVIYQQEFKAQDKLQVKFNYNFVSLESENYKLTDNSTSVSFIYTLPY